MKTFEQLTIEELIDYCIDLKESMQAYKELPEISTILKKKLDLITDEDEKEYYGTVVRDVILEVEKHIENCDYELAKDKMLEEYISNFNIIDKKLKQKIEIEKLLEIELNTINMNYFDNLKQYLLDTSKDYCPKGISAINGRVFERPGDILCTDKIFDRVSINMPNLIDFNFRLDTIGQFQRLDYEQHQETNFPIDIVFNSIINRLRDTSYGKVIEVFRKRTEFIPEVFSCSGMINSVRASSKAMSYFKINRAEELTEVKLKEKNSNWRIISSAAKSFISNKDSENLNEVVWFKIESINKSNNFNYSDIYKNKKISNQNITWFKLMDNENLENNRPVAYCRIDVDGSVTKEEIAYFDTNGEASCKNNKFFLNKDEIGLQPNTLHYFVTDNNGIDKNKSVPVLIGYSESNCLSYIK